MGLRQDFGKRVKELRTSQGLSQEELAFMLGINRVTLYKIVKGKSFVSDKTLEKLGKALGVDISKLFTFKSNKPNDFLDITIRKIKTLNKNNLKTVEIFIETLIKQQLNSK